MATRVALRVSPGASRTAIAGRHGDGRLRVRVAAPAEDGRANRALLTWLAKTLGVRVSAVRLVSGHGSRDKVVEIDAPEACLERLDDAARAKEAS